MPRDGVSTGTLMTTANSHIGTSWLFTVDKFLCSTIDI